MTDGEKVYCIWVDWERHRASLRAVAGYDQIRFFSREALLENVRILSRSGFQFE